MTSSVGRCWMMQPKGHGLSRLSWLRLWSGVDASRQNAGVVTKWSASWRSGGRVCDPAFTRGRTGVPSWGSGLKACGGGASSPWQKDPRPQLPLNQSIAEAGYRLS